MAGARVFWGYSEHRRAAHLLKVVICTLLATSSLGMHGFSHSGCLARQRGAKGEKLTILAHTGDATHIKVLAGHGGNKYKVMLNFCWIRERFLSAWKIYCQTGNFDTTAKLTDTQKHMDNPFPKSTTPGGVNPALETLDCQSRLFWPNAHTWRVGTPKELQK